MNRLWAPWRRAYVTRKKKENGCLFCNKFRSKSDRKNFVLLRTPHSFSLLNLYPYQNGHVMIAPKRHTADLDALTDFELLDLMKQVREIKNLLTRTLKPSGFNIGINLGRSAGAGILGHVHVHIVPRWEGDYNFMPVMGATKIISDSLESMYNLLTDAHKKISRKSRK